jgi:predicted N-acetyltransferase YhbS
MVREMALPQSEIRLQTESDIPSLKRLNDETFGPGRFARTAYRIREQATCDPRLSLCAMLDTRIIGAVQFTPVSIGGTGGALLLGPLIIEKDHSNQGHGLKLMLEGLRRAAALEYKLVILVGDLPYYARAGFHVVPPRRMILPGPVDYTRLLYAELAPGALGLCCGPVKGHRSKTFTL